MKCASILLLSFACLAVCAKCYGGKGFDPLTEFLKVRRTKRSADYAARDVSGEYRPVYVGLQEGQKEADAILSLPGQPEVNFTQYSGYVTVDPDAGRALFYYFAESEDSSAKPLVLWLNGGPGCSSFGAGAMTELGPFRVSPDGETLWYNEHSWNNEANIIFLESPAGVGFSYSNRSSDYITGDAQTAADAYTFLVNWLERFPEYKTRDFYITGESYSGHYVPQLAALVLLIFPRIPADRYVIVFQIGNALIDDEDEGKGYYDYIWTHALISDEIHEAIVENCNFSSGANVSETCENRRLQWRHRQCGASYSDEIFFAQTPGTSQDSMVPLIRMKAIIGHLTWSNIYCTPVHHFLGLPKGMTSAMPPISNLAAFFSIF